MYSCMENFWKSYEKIQSIFINNGFHFRYIDKIRQKVIANITMEKPKIEDITILYYKAPFIKELEKSNENLFRKINAHFNNKAKIRLAYQTTMTASFFPNKDKVADSVKSHLVYQFSCDHCGGCYTGETVRHLSTRVQEHILGRPVPSEVSLHQHVASERDFKVVLQTIHTKIGESLLFKDVLPEKRLNAHRPGFELKLF